MSTAKKGDTVKVHYTGKLSNGSVFDSSREREPLEIKLGDNQVIAGFEEAVVGMAVGDRKSADIPADKAYGERREEMVVAVERSRIPPDLNPEVGQQLRVQQPDGGSLQVVVRKVTDTKITLDGNHPLAGEALSFDIELVEIV